MFDRSKLKGRIVEKFDTQARFAEAIGATPSRVSKILKNEADITAKEITIWAEALGIETSEYGEFFLTVLVQ